jgi:hypothetical protein
MMWVSVVHIEADEDPGYELVRVLKERFGGQVRTLTKQGWLHDAERAAVPPLGKPPKHTVPLPRDRGVR